MLGSGAWPKATHGSHTANTAGRHVRFMINLDSAVPGSFNAIFLKPRHPVALLLIVDCKRLLNVVNHWKIIVKTVLKRLLISR